MTVDRRASAYADQFAPIFISRYIGAARANRADIIPDAIRPSIVAYVNGTKGSNVDANAWMRQALYDYRVRYGKDYPLPPEFSAGKAIARGALTGASIGLGIAASLLKLMR